MKQLLVAILFVAAAPLAAQSDSQPTRHPISLTETALHLAENGVANHNARSVMAAAEILRMAERGSERVQRVGPATEPTGAWDGALSSAALLRLASSMATDQGDRATADYAAWLLQLPASIPVTRGASSGPVWADAYLDRSQDVSYTIDFAVDPHNLLQVSAAKAGTVLECTLREGAATGRVVAKVKSLAGTCAMEWHQASAGRMTLNIKNAGPATFFVVSSN